MKQKTRTSLGTSVFGLGFDFNKTRNNDFDSGGGSQHFHSNTFFTNEKILYRLSSFQLHMNPVTGKKFLVVGDGVLLRI
jgi:hypothetical protein